MIIKLGDEIIDTLYKPFALVFIDDEEANAVGKVISSIKNGDSEYPKDENGVWFIRHPSSITKEKIDKWSVLTDEEKYMLATSARITLNVKNEL